MLKTAICDLFGIEYPIIQGGMVHVATAEMVVARLKDLHMGAWHG